MTSGSKDARSRTPNAIRALAATVVQAVEAGVDSRPDLPELLQELDGHASTLGLSKRVHEAIKSLERQVERPGLPGLAVGAARRIQRLVKAESGSDDSAAQEKSKSSERFPRRPTRPGFSARPASRRKEGKPVDTTGKAARTTPDSRSSGIRREGEQSRGKRQRRTSVQRPSTAPLLPPSAGSETLPGPLAMRNQALGEKSAETRKPTGTRKPEPSPERRESTRPEKSLRGLRPASASKPGSGRSLLQRKPDKSRGAPEASGSRDEPGRQEPSLSLGLSGKPGQKSEPAPSDSSDGLLDGDFLKDLESISAESDVFEKQDSGILDLGLADLDQAWEGLTAEMPAAQTSPEDDANEAARTLVTPRSQKKVGLSAPPSSRPSGSTPSPLPASLPAVQKRERDTVEPPARTGPPSLSPLQSQSSVEEGEDEELFELDLDLNFELETDETPAEKPSDQEVRPTPETSPIQTQTDEAAQREEETSKEETTEKRVPNLRGSGSTPVLKNEEELPLNSLSFDAISQDLDEAFDLSFLTDVSESSREQQSAEDPFAGFDDIDLRWLENHELDVVDEAIDRATEPSGVFEPGTDTGPNEESDLLPIVEEAPVEGGLLPDGSGSLEDSGLFFIFVEDSTISDLEGESGAFEIDVAPPERMSEAEAAYRAFVRHVDRILIRMFDSLELALAGRQYDELIDVERQLNRLARVLDFVELDRQLSLMVYIQDRLPVVADNWQPGEHETLPQREVPAAALQRFESRTGEVLNCFLYLVGYLVHEIPGLSRSRYERALVDLYAVLDLVPGDPSNAAPLGPYGHDDGLKLTSRTRAMLARGYEVRLSQLITSVEASLLHSDVLGYKQAFEYAMEMLGVAEEHELPGLSTPLARLARILESARKRLPGREMVELVQSICDGLTPLLPTFKSHTFVQRMRKVVDRATFSERVRTGKFRTNRYSASSAQFKKAWPVFRGRAAQHIDEILGTTPHVLTDGVERQKSVQELQRVADETGIDLLARLFGAILNHWDRAPGACSVVVEDLAESIRALPDSELEYSQLETLARSVVDDLVRRRTSGNRSSSPSQKSARILQYVTRSTEVSEQIKSAVTEESLGELGEICDGARESSREAAELGLQGLALASSVVAELAGMGREPGTEPPGLLEALQVAETRLSGLLNECVERMDAIEAGDVTHTGVDRWFMRWVARDSQGHRRNQAFERALVETAESDLGVLDAVWASIPPGALPTGEHLERYHRALDGLHQLTWYWARRELFEAVDGHRSSLDEGGGDPRSVDTIKRQFEGLASSIRGALPTLQHTELNQDGQVFARDAFEFLHRLLVAVDGGADQHWSAVARKALEELSPLARGSLFVPFIGIICYLRDIVIRAASEERSGRAEQRIEKLCYWSNRLLTALAPDEIHAERPRERPEVDPTARIPVDELRVLRGTIAELGKQMAEVDTLLDGGPLKLAGKQGRETISSIRELLGKLTQAVDGALPSQLKPRLDRIGRRVTQRAQLQGKPIAVDVEVTDRRENTEAPLPDVDQSRVEAALAALETLAEGVIDHGFEVGDEGSALAFYVEIEGSTASATLTHNGTALDARSLRRALEAVGAPRSTRHDELDRLCSRPDAMKLVPGGGSLAMADALLARIGARLDLDSEPGWTVYAVNLKVARPAEGEGQREVAEASGS